MNWSAEQNLIELFKIDNEDNRLCQNKKSHQAVGSLQ